MRFFKLHFYSANTMSNEMKNSPCLLLLWGLGFGVGPRLDVGIDLKESQLFTDSVKLCKDISLTFKFSLN